MSYRSLPLSLLDHLSVPMCAGIGWLESWSRDRCYACERNTVEWESCTDRELHNFNNLKQRPRKRCLQLPAPINDLSTISTTQKQHTGWLILITMTVPPILNTRQSLDLDGSKHTDHYLQSFHAMTSDSWPITSRLSWPITSMTRVIMPSTAAAQITWLWTWLSLCLSKRQSQNVILNSPSQDYTHPDDRTSNKA